jgi:hypothetical protein
MSSAARQLLAKGMDRLYGEYAESFTVDGFGARQFTALCQEVFYGNTLGEGGFLPDAETTIYVKLDVFALAGLHPWPGMRINIFDREWIVNRVGQNRNRWNLTLQVAHPKETDLAAQIRVIGTADGQALGYKAGQILVKE